ncbi:probable E3 ubiquitin-protein ligase XERICO [Salvia hispanica]|uniref:probable E3 ubiquitin-protein ligase XERICO n=1 Tax=Salvia hispanica TaxID=49212 RepID=UPI0020098011|nr:probable E3 ubiquitin-protein ligase XERICO [Salvia hispanica]
MGFSSYIITLPNHQPFTKFIFSNIMSQFLSNMRPRSNVEDYDEFRPSPSSVQLPDYLTTKSFDKGRLPTVEHATFRSHNKDGEEEEGDDCAVCLSRIEAWHIVRELDNCEHAFHVGCLDSWIDRGGETCPVCRAQLVSGDREEVGHGKDPWRSQRMVYLFGEDCLMEELQ